MVYRHIFFDGPQQVFINHKGKMIQYYGNIYSNARKMENFFSIYDSKQDLYIACGNCAKKQYSGLMKVTK